MRQIKKNYGGYPHKVSPGLLFDLPNPITGGQGVEGCQIGSCYTSMDVEFHVDQLLLKALGKKKVAHQDLLMKKYLLSSPRLGSSVLCSRTLFSINWKKNKKITRILRKERVLIVPKSINHSKISYYIFWYQMVPHFYQFDIVCVQIEDRLQLYVF